MTAFFICIILIGVMMTAIAMIWIVIEKKKSRDYRLEIDERKNDLQQVVEDAEQLLNELNNFSNYIVTRMEEKQQEVEAVIQAADEKLCLFEQIDDIQFEMPEKEKVIHVMEAASVSKPESPVAAGKKAKVIPLNEKKRQVIKLYNDGLDSTEIAKLLNMGKGEIELISRMVQ